jgi:hypothetical protein
MAGDPDCEEMQRICSGAKSSREWAEGKFFFLTVGTGLLHAVGNHIVNTLAGHARSFVPKMNKTVLLRRNVSLRRFSKGPFQE